MKIERICWCGKKFLARKAESCCKAHAVNGNEDPDFSIDDYDQDLNKED